MKRPFFSFCIGVLVALGVAVTAAVGATGVALAVGLGIGVLTGLGVGVGAADFVGAGVAVIFVAINVGAMLAVGVADALVPAGQVRPED